MFSTFNLKKLNSVEFRDRYQVKMSNGFEDMKNFDDKVDNSRTWESIRISKLQPMKI
jgi:hypothetical protein